MEILPLVCEIARRIAYRHQTEFRDVNAALNRAAGIRRVDDATIEQLEERLATATRWLAGGGPGLMPL